MKLTDVTIITGVDALYVQKLMWTYRTWIKFRPEMLSMKMIVVYDKSQIGLSASDGLSQFDSLRKELGHADVRFVGWDLACPTQREKMLTGLVMVPAREVDTPWYLKLDADTLATESDDGWFQEGWFAKEKDQCPAHIASPWGYTKPANMLDRLDDWGDTVPALAKYPRLNIPYLPDATRVCSPRMASWVMFGNTQWTKEASALCKGDRLPVPSQDTFLYYVAARRRDFYRRIKMKSFGWDHVSKLQNLVRSCHTVLGY